VSNLREENVRLKLRVGEAPDHDPRPEQPPSIVEGKPQSSATVTVVLRLIYRAADFSFVVALFKHLFIQFIT
jgi:hypothetical protein